jgi:HNH endonuclease
MAITIDGTAGITFPNGTNPQDAPSQEYLHSKFEYKDGQLYWKVATRGNRIGDKAGCSHGDGYVSVGVDGKKLMAHRIIFCMQHGYMPELVDHINGDRKNNRIENLRAATKRQNAQNTKLRGNSSTGLKNVRWHKLEKKWQVSLRIEGKETHFGYYDDVELADLVATEARDKYFGKFANHGVTL